MKNITRNRFGKGEREHTRKKRKKNVPPTTSEPSLTLFKKKAKIMSTVSHTLPTVVVIAHHVLLSRWWHQNESKSFAFKFRLCSQFCFWLCFSYSIHTLYIIILHMLYTCNFSFRRRCLCHWLVGAYNLIARSACCWCIQKEKKIEILFACRIICCLAIFSLLPSK